LAPGPADHILADCTLEQAEKRPLHAPRVGPGQIDRRDQSLGFLRQPPVARQSLRSPLGDLARLVLDPGARHAQRFGAKSARELPIAVPMAIALCLAAATAVADATEKFGQLLLEHRFDGGPDTRPQAFLDRIVSGLVGQ
jgi:hypothetical protein